MASQSLRDLLAEPGCLLMPAVYDALSARLAERAGFRAIGLGGFLVAASRLGGPDIGQLTMTEMVEHLRGVADAVSIPVMADADTGYGNPLNVRRTVQAYVANMFTMGKSPLFTAGELAAMGYRVALWVMDALWAAARAVDDVLRALHRDGTTAAVRDRLMSFDEYFALVGLDDYQRLEHRYAE